MEPQATVCLSPFLPHPHSLHPASCLVLSQEDLWSACVSGFLWPLAGEESWTPGCQACKVPLGRWLSQGPWGWELRVAEEGDSCAEDPGKASTSQSSVAISVHIQAQAPLFLVSEFYFMVVRIHT
jgi:hypothetical protein